MSYASRDDIVKRWGVDWLPQKLASDGSSTEDTDRVTSALADADALINTHLNERYVLPIATPPYFLKALACDIAKYRLSADVLDSDSPSYQRYHAAINSLQQIKDGNLDLVGIDAIDSSAFTESQNPQYQGDRII